MDLAEQGLFPYVNGKKLVLTPVAKLTDSLRSQVLIHKSALLVNLTELQKLDGWDWSAFEVNPGRFKAFAEMVMIVEQRGQGICPDHYTATTECKHCGLVPIFEGCPSKINGCPWCFNRLKGLPIPRVPHCEEYDYE